MKNTEPEPQPLSRRHLLKAGLLGGALLTTAGLSATLSGCAAEAPKAGYSVIRESDLGFLHAILPVILAGAIAPKQMEQALETTLTHLDYSLNHLSPEILKQIMQLLDVLALPVTRGPLTGIWGSWQNASANDIKRFLKRWENSSIGLLKMGHSALLQLVLMSWYSDEEAWAHCGYPGPPRI